MNITDVEVGMVLAEPILNDDGTIELLSKDTKLTERQITLLKRLGIMRIKIKEASEDAEESRNIFEHLDAVEKGARKNGDLFDLASLKAELAEIEQEDFEPVVTSVVNVNMEVKVLTGRNGLPFDEQQSQMIEQTQAIFQTIREGGDIDLEGLRQNVSSALPDMIRHNDVLMRLNQIKETDDYTFQHSLRVSILATMIGKWLGYSHDELVELGEAGLLFDIGKMKVPPFILQKRDQVSDEEYEILKKHAQLGYMLLLKTEGITPNIKYGALQHHERLDGTGYPLRLREGQIHEFAKIIMICDVFDALTHDRPYAEKVSPFKAAEYISWNSGTKFDPKMSYILLHNLAQYFYGKDVRLNTGETGRIVYVDHNFPTRPVVEVGNRFYDLVKESEIQIEDLL